MATTRSDMYILSTDTTFTNRVRASLVAACVSIVNEARTTAYHRERETYAVSILNSPDAFKTLFATTVATDALVIGDATASGTVVLTAGNVATQQALCTDAHIDTAVSGQFNCFFRTPAN